MAKQKTLYQCSNCGAQNPKWVGKCTECEEYNTFEEIVADERKSSVTRLPNLAATKAQPVTEINPQDYERLPLFSAELNRVLGGGVIPGSIILLGGSPGVGKSSLLTQVAAGVATSENVLYASAEESAEQIKVRIDRFEANSDNFYLMCESNLETILSETQAIQPSLLIIDSIQTIYTSRLESSPGLVSQVRECASMLQTFAKNTGISILVIGHVTKDNSIAGPRVLEHIVDATLYLEGDEMNIFRILRGVKNRFGSTNEIGVFHMGEHGLEDVKNPSQFFIESRNSAASGTCIGVTVKGTRPILVETQALIEDADHGNPYRNVNGVDRVRVQMLAGVLTKHGRVAVTSKPINVNIVGGMKIQDTGIDLPILMAMTSSYFDTPLPAGLVAVGEVDLAGGIRSIARIEQRINEAVKIGMTDILVPPASVRLSADSSARLHTVSSVKDVVDMIKNIN